MYIKIFNNSMINRKKGFTLIELLVVIGILAILLSITLIAINPARQFGNANNTKRRSAITQILNAIGAYQAEQGGVLPAEIVDNTILPVGTAVAISGANFPNLCDELLPEYIPALPVEPSDNQPDIVQADCAAAAWDTGYEITRDATNRLTISAPTTDNGEVIEVSR